MSVLKLELKEEHLKLLKYLKWSVNNNIIVGVSNDEDSVPFGENNIYEAIDLILNGMPENHDPFNTEELVEYSDEQKAEWDKLYSELPIALSIVLQRGSFEIGSFKAKYHDQVWKKIKQIDK